MTSLSDARFALAVGRARASECLQPIFKADWPSTPLAESTCIGAWRSKEFLAVLYVERRSGHRRLSVNRTRLDSTGGWRDGITWDELMRVKREAGFGDAWCVEVYPPDDEIVNVANMRHLWLLDDAPPYAWTSLDQRTSVKGDVAA